MVETAVIITESGLVYVNDTMPGIYRKGKPGKFYYEDAAEKKIKDPAQLQRIQSLVLPPAWTSVWISLKANAYLQATGFDLAGRKQYRYHSKWTKRRSEHKYYRLLDFGKALPQARKRIKKDLLRRSLDEQKVLAICVDLLQKTLIRVGGKDYLQKYGSIGLSTLKDQHVKIKGNSLNLSFIGKKGVRQQISLTDRQLSKLVKKCRDIPGQELFQFYDGDGQRRSIDSGRINAYIKEITGNDFTAKDFRTWGATLEALRQLAVCQASPEVGAKSKIEVQVLDEVAKKLGNTRAVCKSAYVYPLLLEAHRNDALDKWLKKVDTGDSMRDKTIAQNEQVLLSFLKWQAMGEMRSSKQFNRASGLQ